MQWATRLALFLGGIPWLVRAVVTWIAVLPIVVVLSIWTSAPTLLTWIWGALLGVVATFIAYRRDRDALFGPEEARLAARAVLTGAGTGDPDVDGYALGLLDARMRVGQAPERIALSVVVLLLMAAPIVAGIRSSVWWLLILPLEVALGVGAIPYLALDIKENIRRLEAAIPPETEPS
jgi:hypothetical protein